MLNRKELGRAIAKAIELKIATGLISSKAEVARHFNIKTPSLYGWIEKGTISKSKLPELWRYFSDVVGPEHWGLADWPIEPPIAKSHVKNLRLISGSQEQPLKQGIDNSATFHVLDVKAACGNGHHNHDYPETVRTLIMSPEEAQRLIGSQNKNGAIQVILASKDSMAPAIQPDDLLFVDTSIKDYVGEAVYILLHGGELVCKRISLVGRELTVSSDNKAYPSWPWRERPEETKIIGKVIKALPMSFKKFGAV